MISGIRDTLVSFLVHLLEPIAAFCLRRGVKVQDAIECFKQAFAKAAHRELVRAGETASVSKVAIMTGLHRRDATRLSLGIEKNPEDPALTARILGQWRSDRRFLGRDGRPKILTIKRDGGDFLKLVHSVSKDLNAYTVLFELERIGAVERDGDKLKLKRDVFVPKEDIRGGLGLLASDAKDLFLAVEENLFGSNKTPHLHIKTFYDNVCEDNVEEIRQWFLDKGAIFHEEARRYLSQFDKDINPRLHARKGGVRVAVGSFSRIELSQIPKKVKQ